MWRCFGHAGCRPRSKGRSRLSGCCFFFQAEDGIRDLTVTGVQTCALPISVGTLALAYYFSDDEKYAERAARLLRVWFLDPGTRMNPNLRYGQRIPGIAEGRGAGIIETRSLVGLVDAIGMLERSPAWTHTAAGGMRSWMSAYLQWLRTSEIGKEERSRSEEHTSELQSQSN